MNTYNKTNVLLKKIKINIRAETLYTLVQHSPMELSTITEWQPLAHMATEHFRVAGVTEVLSFTLCLF